MYIIHIFIYVCYLILYYNYKIVEVFGEVQRRTTKAKLHGCYERIESGMP